MDAQLTAAPTNRRKMNGHAQPVPAPAKVAAKRRPLTAPPPVQAEKPPVMLGKFKVHPVANWFPLIENTKGDSAWDRFVEDIRQNGLNDPIVLSADSSTIIDGRNRFRACQEAGILLRWSNLPDAYTEDDIKRYIISRGVARRELTQSMKACVAVEYILHLEADAERRSLLSATIDRSEAVERTAKNVPEEQFPLVRGDVAKSKLNYETAALIFGASIATIERAIVLERMSRDKFDRVKRGQAKLMSSLKLASIEHALASAKAKEGVEASKGDPTAFPVEAKPGDGDDKPDKPKKKGKQKKDDIEKEPAKKKDTGEGFYWATVTAPISNTLLTLAEVRDRFDEAMQGYGESGAHKLAGDIDLLGTLLAELRARIFTLFPSSTPVQPTSAASLPRRGIR